MSIMKDVEHRAQTIEDLDRIDKLAFAIIANNAGRLVGLEDRGQIEWISKIYSVAINTSGYSIGVRDKVLRTAGFTPERI